MCFYTKNKNVVFSRFSEIRKLKIQTRCYKKQIAYVKKCYKIISFLTLHCIHSQKLSLIF